MKKIVIIIAVTTIPLITIIGGLYFLNISEQRSAINEAIESIESPYYQKLAKACANKDKSEYRCCLSSVYSMVDLEGKLSTDSECQNMTFDSLYCLGAYKWCVPIANVTSPSIDGVEKNCTVDSDCVPATCCHATDVVNKDFAPDCSDIMCTMSCETVLDCGRGEPICKESVCSVKIK